MSDPINQAEEDFDAVEHEGRVPTPYARWASRRRMAQLSLFGVLSTQAWTFVNAEASRTQVDLLTSTLWVYGAVIASYMGFKMVEQGFGRK